MFSIHDDIQVIDLLEKNGYKKFRYGQLENALYKNFLSDFEEMNTLPKEIRNLLTENCFYTSLSVYSVTSDAE